MKLVFATNNPHKLTEVNSLTGERFQLLTLNDAGFHDELHETSETLAGNALQKAKAVFDKTGLSCFADDTGLFIEALDGRPGVYSARYAGENCNPDDNIKKVLTEMKGVKNRSAKFITVIALVVNGEEYFFEGQVEGTILEKPEGIKGFGYDPIFRPDGFKISFAEMSLDEKNKISHRARAFRKFAHHITSEL